MPITNPDVPLRVLDALTAADVPFVVLHSEGLVADGRLDSDVDLAVGIPVDEVISRISDDLKETGLRIATVWTYDIGGAAALFVATVDGSEGAQIDLLYDPQGEGRYGARSNPLLDRARPGVRYQVPDELDEHLYLLRKRICKADADKAQIARAALSSLANEPYRNSRARELFSPAAARTVIRYMRSGDPPRRERYGKPVGNLIRRLRRLREPPGLWVELLGAPEKVGPLARILAQRFGRWMLRAVASEHPSGFLRSLWWFREVVRIRLRPGVLVSWGNPRGWPRPDLSLAVDQPGGVDAVATEIVEALSQRTSQ